MDGNQDKPSVQLNGFAPPSGSGAASLSSLPGSAAASASATGAASASAMSSTAAAGGGTGGSPAKKPPSAAAKPKRANARKKAKGGSASSAASSRTGSDANDIDADDTEIRPLSDVGADFSPTSLPQIRLRLSSLLERLPGTLPPQLPAYNAAAPPGTNEAHHPPVFAFAAALQVVIEEYNLLLALVSAATYKWGVDRSGASQQNLSVMSAELQQCQEVISNVVSSRLSNVLCPAVDVCIGEVEVVRDSGAGAEGGEGDGGANAGPAPTKKRKLLNEDKLSTGAVNNNERRINHFARPICDPSYVHLCHCILARNAPLIRHTVATSVHAAQRVIGDYLKAMKKDASHDSGKGGYY